MTTKAKILRDVEHGDWKTNLVRPRPTLKKGTVVDVVEEWTNFYGRWIKVETADGTRYDIEPDALARLEGAPK